MADRAHPQELENFPQDESSDTDLEYLTESHKSTSQDRIYCWAAGLLLAALCVLATIMAGVYGYEALEKAHIDVDITSVTIAFLLSLTPWLALVLPYSAVGVVLPYFFCYLPGFLLVYLNVVIGSAFSFGAARWVARNSRWSIRFIACFPGKAKYVGALRTVFKERCCFLAALAMWGPIPIPLMVVLVGLLTDADFLVFWLSSSVSTAVQLLPMMCLAAESSDIKKTLDSGNPVSIAVLVGGLLVFLVLSCLVAHFVSKELDKHVQKAEVCELTNGSSSSTAAYSSVSDSICEPDEVVTHVHAI